MTWARRLKRVFTIDIETRSKYGGEMKIIASIEDPTVIHKILAHLNNKLASTETIVPSVQGCPACRPRATGDSALANVSEPDNIGGRLCPDEEAREYYFVEGCHIIETPNDPFQPRHVHCARAG